MFRVASTAALALVLASLSVGARADWRYGDDWRWRHHPHSYYGSPRVIMVYPAPPPVVYAPAPPVVYVNPSPVEAIPTSPPYTDPSGRYCREYQTTVRVDGASQPAYGTACLMPDGQWRIVR
ncbi:MAG TPA: hypothetical protein VK196_14600 [Magnetospirillum sp.]|nr:hypothetical protein [Magnetospirillum sp.]